MDFAPDREQDRTDQRPRAGGRRQYIAPGKATEISLDAEPAGDDREGQREQQR